MRIKYSFVVVVVICLLACSCRSTKSSSYSFFIAGHVYGKACVDNEGVHPPFKQKFEYLKSREEIEFGVLLGDIVWIPSEKDWDEVDRDIEILGLPVYIACGNHEMKDKELFKDRYGETYYSFLHNDDLFIVLDPNINRWNISNEQLEFLKGILVDNSEKVDNIFVFTHQLLWWDEDNKYSEFTLNSLEGRDENLNFWREVEPLFHSLSNNIVFFAGDIGATERASDFMYDSYDNITFIASGMGEGNGDNFVVVNVDNDKNVSFDVICLDEDDPNCFGKPLDWNIGKE